MVRQLHRRYIQGTDIRLSQANDQKNPVRGIIRSQMNNYHYIIAGLPDLSRDWMAGETDADAIIGEIKKLCSSRDVSVIEFLEDGYIAENLTGRKFGLLTVIERVENRKDRTCWRCLCECGNEKTATAHDLKAGKVKSCGCLRHARHTRYRDLTGERIGRLTVLRPTSDRDKKGSVIWECKCDCGNTVCFSEDQLKHGHCKSCGCLRNELRKDIHNQLHLVDGTCVEMLEKRKHRKDNTSGFRGVYKLKDGGYRASIGFRGKRYHLGMFTDFNEAVEARINAERLTHDKFVHEYHLWEEKAKADPEWGELNPFRCNIRLT